MAIASDYFGFVFAEEASGLVVEACSESHSVTGLHLLKEFAERFVDSVAVIEIVLGLSEVATVTAVVTVTAGGQFVAAVALSVAVACSIAVAAYLTVVGAYVAAAGT